MNIDFGLSVLFDGKSYMVMWPSGVKEYPIGGLICEYCRVVPAAIKEVIMTCSHLDEKPNTDNLCDVIMELQTCLPEKFPLVGSIMVLLELSNSVLDWTQAMRENRVDEFVSSLKSIENNDTIKDFIFEGIDEQDFGCDTVRQVLLMQTEQSCRPLTK